MFTLFSQPFLTALGMKPLKTVNNGEVRRCYTSLKRGVNEITMLSPAFATLRLCVKILFAMEIGSRKGAKSQRNAK